MLGDAGQRVGEPGLRINVVHFDRLCRPPNYAERACFPQYRGDGHVIGSA
jgi:hypothetical protein